MSEETSTFRLNLMRLIYLGNSCFSDSTYGRSLSGTKERGTQ